VKPVLFVSDVHLSPARPERAAAFRRFLEGEAAGAAALYVLGDLFDHWLGDDEAADEFNGPLLEAFSRLAARGVPVAMMHGNRDFLLTPGAAGRAGVELLPDPVLREIAGVPTLLTHGDLLCTDDVRYQRFRRVVRNPAVQGAFLALPWGLRGRIGARLKRLSETEKAAKAAPEMDVNARAVEDWLRRHGCPRLIHGHTHRPARHVHAVDGRECERWVLPDWYRRGGWLACDEAGCRLVDAPA
jgi:UDP-2,3-diacylglucosamine hydrolase